MTRAFVLLLTAASAVVAQVVSVIDYSKLPSCAKNQCVILAQSEANCVPAVPAPNPDQANYQACVCQSTLLSSLHSSGQLCQQAGCSADDATKISQYYQDLCNSPAAAVPAPAGTTTLLATTTTSTASTTTSTSSQTAAGAGAGGASKSNKRQTWWESHWKWIVMVIVVGLGIIIIWVGGVFLRRHYTRKHDAERANLAARDAPYNPSTPGSKSTMSTGVTPQQMTMSGARTSTITMDGVGGIAPPRGSRLSRSRTNTLQSLTVGNGSRTNVASQPVVWGPHQHLAQGNGNGSPSSSVPPSPTSAITPPNPILRNSQAMRSEPRFVQFRQTPTSPLSGDPRANPEGENIPRPHTANGGRVGNVRTHSLNAVRSDPTLTPHFEPQTAEIVDSSSRGKLTKQQY